MFFSEGFEHSLLRMRPPAGRRVHGPAVQQAARDALMKLEFVGATPRLDGDERLARVTWYAMFGLLSRGTKARSAQRLGLRKVRISKRAVFV